MRAISLWKLLLQMVHVKDHSSPQGPGKPGAGRGQCTLVANATTGVVALMVLQHLPLAAEMVPAGPTDVGLALLMGPPVPGEGDLLSEVLPTHGAGVGLLPCVNSLVGHQHRHFFLNTFLQALQQKSFSPAGVDSATRSLVVFCQAPLVLWTCWCLMNAIFWWKPWPRSLHLRGGHLCGSSGGPPAVTCP